MIHFKHALATIRNISLNQKLREKLAGLPRLDSANRQTAPCKVCGHHAFLFDVVDFNKSCSQPEIYPFGAAGLLVPYLCCSVCNFIFTPFLDDWTPDDFARYIYNDDYVKVDGEYAGVRPEREAIAMARRLAGHSHLRILDYGSGSGLFAKGLASRGFAAVNTYDPFSNPERPNGQFDVITCFEVLEHTVNPRVCLDDIASFLEPGGCILFSTGIPPANIDVLRANWWYVAPRNGHVSIYSLNALARLGRHRGLTLHAGESLLGYGDPAPSAASRDILAGVGPAVEFFRLTAPGPSKALPPDQRSLWHGPEGVNAGRTVYRWTASSDIAWTVSPRPLESCNVIVTIPIQNEVEFGFADHCRVHIGTQSAPLTRHPDGLCASLSIRDPVDPVVRLVMPPLLRPCDLRPVSDARPLGLAITAEDA